jgi:hypothetical protein
MGTAELWRDVKLFDEMHRYRSGGDYAAGKLN